MRTYRISEPLDPAGERAILKSLRNHFDDRTAVSIDLTSGEVSVEDDADPQIVLFAIEGAGFTVDGVTETVRDRDARGRPPRPAVKKDDVDEEFDPDEPIDSAVSTEDEPPPLVETIDPQSITPPDGGGGRE